MPKQILQCSNIDAAVLPAVNDQDALLATMALEDDLYEWARHKADEGALSQSELEHFFAEQRYSGYERSSGGKGFSGMVMTYQDDIKRDMRIWGYVVIGVALVLGLIAGFGEAKAKRNRDGAEQSGDGKPDPVSS